MILYIMAKCVNCGRKIETYIRSPDRAIMHPWVKDSLYEKLRDKKNKTDVKFL